MFYRKSCFKRAAFSIKTIHFFKKLKTKFKAYRADKNCFFYFKIAPVLQLFFIINNNVHKEAYSFEWHEFIESLHFTSLRFTASQE